MKRHSYADAIALLADSRTPADVFSDACQSLVAHGAELASRGQTGPLGGLPPVGAIQLDTGLAEKLDKIAAELARIVEALGKLRPYAGYTGPR